MDSYEKMFGDLPEHIRVIAKKIAVKEMVAARTSQKLEMATETVTKLREEFQQQVEEIGQLKADLHNESRQYMKENV